MASDSTVKTPSGIQPELNIQPVERLALIDQIIATVKRLIAEEKLRPGDVIPSERDLAEMFKVSRTSMRQALKALSFMGVLEIRHGSRTCLSTSASRMLVNPMHFISLLHNVTVEELFQTRKVLEVALAELATANATPEDISKMQGALDDAAAHLDDPKEFLHGEMLFHEFIVQAAGNHLLAAMMNSINALLVSSRERSVFLFQDLRYALKLHLDIMHAVHRKSPKAAGKAMLAHLDAIEHLLHETQ